MATNQNSIVFKMAYAPVDHLFEGGRRLALILMIWWSLSVLVLYVVSAVIEFWYSPVSFEGTLGVIVGGVLVIWFTAWSIGYVVRGFLGVRG